MHLEDLNIMRNRSMDSRKATFRWRKKVTSISGELMGPGGYVGVPVGAEI